MPGSFIAGRNSNGKYIFLARKKIKGAYYLGNIIRADKTVKFLIDKK